MWVTRFGSCFFVLGPIVVWDGDFSLVGSLEHGTARLERLNTCQLQGGGKARISHLIALRNKEWEPDGEGRRGFPRNADMADSPFFHQLKRWLCAYAEVFAGEGACFDRRGGR